MYSFANKNTRIQTKFCYRLLYICTVVHTVREECSDIFILIFHWNENSNIVTEKAIYIFKLVLGFV